MENSSNPLNDVLFVLVACTQDKTRQRGLNATISALNEQHAHNLFSGNLFVFDNASAITEPFKNLKAPALFGISPENIGYWGALLWTVRNFEAVTRRKFKYIHPIESDLVVRDLYRVAEAKQFLEINQNFATVRTQEFSVSFRYFYYKNRWNPFRVRRSMVSNFNVITNEKVKFRRSSTFPNIYETNWHAKVPALHRWEPFAKALEVLALQPRLSEHDFMREMHRQHQQVGVLNGGVWWIHSGFALPKDSKSEIIGSYTPSEILAKYGYRTTRVDAIPSELPEVSILKGWRA